MKYLALGFITFGVGIIFGKWREHKQRLKEDELWLRPKDRDKMD